MADIIASALLLIAVGAAIAYIVKQNRRGVKCIGCTAGEGACSVQLGCSSDCSGGCPAAESMTKRMQDEIK